MLVNRLLAKFMESYIKIRLAPLTFLMIAYLASCICVCYLNIGYRILCIYLPLGFLSAVLILEYVAAILIKQQVLVSQNRIDFKRIVKIALLLLISDLMLALILSEKELNLGKAKKMFVSSTEITREISVMIQSQPRIYHEYVVYDSVILQDKDIRIRVYGPRYPVVEFGSKCILHGNLKSTERIDNNGYVRYLNDRSIYFVMYADSMNCIVGDGLLISLVRWKNRMINNIEMSMNEPQASLVAGIMFGENRDFDDSFKEKILVSGTSHVVAASGYNIGFVAGVFSGLFWFVSRRERFFLLLLFVWGYAFIAGFSVSVLRAVLLFSVVEVERFLGLYIKNWYTLILILFILLLINPYYMRDAGFLLSVSASLGIVYISPLVKRVRFLRSDTIASSLSCYVSTLPILFMIFGKIQIISIVVNPIVLMFAEDVMLIGFVGAAGYQLYKPLGKYVLQNANFLMLCFEKSVEAFGSFVIQGSKFVSE